MSEHKYSQVCHCENCGNESEMVVTCQLESTADAVEQKEAVAKKPEEKKVLGQAVCTNCGNEADMWVDVPEQS